MERWLWVAVWLAAVAGGPLPHEVDSEQTRKLLGSSVVTSVSVIMDHGNGTKTYITDGDLEKKPQIVGTPGTLLSPDRYEFYSFGEDGELVKKLMTLDQIQSLIAGGDELEPLPVYDPQPLVDNTQAEGVHKVLESVQNVLKGELQAAKVHQKVPMPLSDDSWSILLPGLLNSDLDFKEPQLPLKGEMTSTTSLKPQKVSNYPTSAATTSKPQATSTKHTTTSKPINQITVSQYSTFHQTTEGLESIITKKPTTDTKYRPYHSTNSPYVKTTGFVVNKPQNQKPQITTKKPITSTKKPYVSETPYAKVPLANISKLDVTTTTITATTKTPITSKKPSTVEERIPSTKFPDTKKPLPEKQKPSGIPTITHYLPITSISPPSTQKLSTPVLKETTMNQYITPTSKEPIRITTKQPSPTTTPTSVHKVTKRPVSNKVTLSNNNKTHLNTTLHNDKITFKIPITAAPTTTITKSQHKTTAVPTVITTTKDSTIPVTTKDEVTTSTEKLEIHFTTDTELAATTTKDSLLPSPEKLVFEKQQEVKPLNTQLGENTEIVNTKVKPSTSSIAANITSTTFITSENRTQTSTISYTTPFPDKITTFSYTSKITPNGEIITITQPNFNSTAQKPTTWTTVETLAISTHKPTFSAPSKTTEKPEEKLTMPVHQSSKPIENVRDSILVSSSMQPTTYHPHNFSLPSKKPAVHKVPSTTPVSFTLVKVNTISESQKQPTVTTTLPTKSSEHFSTSTIKTPSLISSSTIAIATTWPAVTKPTTMYANIEETTTSATTFISNSTSETTINDSTTNPTEEMPFQEIPLKIYESLKDNVNNAQDVMTTVMTENLLTTPPRIVNTYSTNLEEIIPLSTTTSTDKATTMLDAISSTNTPFSKNKIVIINNSEPHIVEKNSISITSSILSDLNGITNEPIDSSTAKPLDQKKFNSSFDNTSEIQAETTTFPTTVPDNISDQEILETTPFSDSTTIYKDQIIQEGISAVTSILLDEAQKQQTIKQAILATEIKNNENGEFERIKTTTENEHISTTDSDSTELPTEKFVTDRDQMKSEVRLNEDAELPEKVTTEAVETTIQEEKPKSEVSLINDEVKESGNFSNHQENLKRTEHKTTLVLPTKESKLNPDSDLVKRPDKLHSENTPLLRTSPIPELAATTERIKHSDLEKPIPKPLSTFVKKPSSVYQSLDNLPPVAIELNPAPYESMGLEASIAFLGEDVRRFADLCNELAFRLWTSITGKGQIASRSLVMSPFAVTSLLAMVFLGARGPTSGQMNDVLRLDDMVTFNPHQVLQNVTESVINSKNNGVATAAFVRELYSDKTKGKILDFYKERVQQYYQGHVEEVTFTTIGDIIRRRTNLLVKRQTLGKVPEYLRGSSLNMRPPLAAFSANIFQTDCEHGSTEGRDGEMYFVVRPSTRQRRLVPVPAVVWRSGFLAGYETSLDATSVCLGPESVVSTILILPGQQGQVAPGDGLARLEQRLIETTYRRGGWSQILRSLMPRPGLELQIPRFSHRSVLNVTGALQRMGLRDLFSARRADLRGLNGLSNDLHLSDMLQINTFSTCGEETIGARHHVETYPASPQRMGRDEPERYPLKDFDKGFGNLPLSHRPRQARLPDNPRLRFDRPFLYMVRHNPSGMILHMGRFNPRLLP